MFKRISFISRVSLKELQQIKFSSKAYDRCLPPDSHKGYNSERGFPDSFEKALADEESTKTDFSYTKIRNDPNNQFSFKIPALCTSDIDEKFNKRLLCVTMPYFKLTADPWLPGETIREKKTGQVLNRYRVSFICKSKSTSKRKIDRSKITRRLYLAVMITFPKLAALECDYLFHPNYFVLKAPWEDLLNQVESSIEKMNPLIEQERLKKKNLGL